MGVKLGLTKRRTLIEIVGGQAQRRTVGRRGEEVVEEWRSTHNEELFTEYY
jgi:hypothetical protein